MSGGRGGIHGLGQGGGGGSDGGGGGGGGPQMPGGGGGPGEMFSNWKSTAPALSSYAPYVGLVSVIGSFFILSFTRLWIDSIFKSYQVWRLFTSPLVDSSFFQCIFGAVFLYICCSRIEKVKGSIFVLHLLFISTLLTNLMFTFVGGFFAYAPFFGFTTTLANPITGEEVPHPSFTSAGLYPIVFAVFVMETSLSNEERRRFLCFPWMVVTTSLPLVFLAFYQLMGLLSGVIHFDAMCGVAVGYLITYVLTGLQISPTRARNWEHARWLAWLTGHDNFVGIDNGGTALPGVWSNPSAEQAAAQQGQGGSGFSMFGGAPQGGGGSGGSASGGGSGGASNQTDHSKSSTRSAFSGPGYTLSSGSSTSAAQNGAGSSVGGRSGGGGTHPLALRYAENQRTESKADNPSMYGGDSDRDNDTLIDIPGDDQGTTRTAPRDRIPLFDIQLQHLTELGYTEADATPALEFSGGDVEKAVAYLQGRVDEDD